MKVKGKITKLLFNKPDFKIYGFEPNNKKEIETNIYGGITVKGNIPELTMGKEYTFVLSKDSNPKYKDSYNIEDIDPENFKVDENVARDFIEEITSGYLVDSIYSAYPNFATLILEGKENEIDLNKIKGVKEKRFEMLKEKIQDKFKYYQVVVKFPEYKFKISEAKEMFQKQPITQKLYEEIENNPYYWLIDECNRGFEKSDAMICSYDEKWLTSETRMEYCMLYILDRNEYDKNTYMDANQMAHHCKQYTPECYKLIKKVAQESPLINYDEETKRISKMSTYLCELYIAGRTKEMIEKSSQINIDYKKYCNFGEFTLTDEQEKLLEYALKYNIIVLTAGAGEGKSFSIKALTDMLEDNKLTYTLLGPTGKASKVLAEYTKRPCSTIHRRLGLNPKTLNPENTIETDYCILDESSMVGIGLMKAVFSALSNDTRLILVCDPYQISSLSVGNVVADMINSEVVPVVRLSKNLRFGGGVYLASLHARSGENFIQNNNFTLGEDCGYKYVKPTNYFDDVMFEYEKLLNQGVDSKDIMVLSPHNVNELGTYNFNSVIQDMINPLSPNDTELSYKRNGYDIKFRVGDRVMNTVNTYDVRTLDRYNDENKAIDDLFEDEDEYMPNKVVNIFNGEEGIVRSIKDKVMVCQFEEEMVVFKDDEIQQLLLGYAINHFKAQGSSSDYVICVESPMHSNSLSRGLYYTGLTRAKKQVIDVGDKKTIEQALEKVENENRKTMLKELLIQEG